MKTPMQELIHEMQKSPLMFASALTLVEQMKMLQKEKEVAQQYAEFAIECDRKKLPVLEFYGWLNL